MDDLQHIGYSREVIEFVAVAKEFCGYLEGSHEEDASELLSKLQKFIPLIYLKGSLLPSCESDNLGMMEEVVTEEDYNALLATLSRRISGSFRREYAIQRNSGRELDFRETL